MKRLLYIVNGLGMGNSTRCHSVIQHHNPGMYEIDVLTSGNGLKYFQNVDQIREIDEFENLFYAKDSKGNLTVFGSILGLPVMVMRYARNVFKLRGKLRAGNYSAIIIDSDYSTFFVKRLAGVPIIALNNADIVVEECKKRRPLPPSIKMQYWVERLDRLFHRIIPHHVVSPTLTPGQGSGNLVHVPPMVRSQLRPQHKPGEVRHILLMLSGSDFGTNTDFLDDIVLPEGVVLDVVGREGMSDERIVFHGKVFDNTELLNRADVMVINAGFSAVSEAAFLGCPVVVIPVANHAEQYINAQLISELGLGVVADSGTVLARLSHVIDHHADFLARHQEYNCLAGGAKSAATAIENWAAGADHQGTEGHMRHPMPEK
ncbi:MAG: hypothetical protein NXI27_25935 [Alphaproteobacteria bacterium]|nr:hypothetical protein [Alphaproteobacteria bacterium]